MTNWSKNWHIKRRKEWRHVQRKDSCRQFPLFGTVILEGEFKGDYAVWVSEGGWCGRRWLTTTAFERALGRWVKRAYEAGSAEFQKNLAEIGGDLQCGGCSYFAAFDSDYGLCANPLSSMDGRVTFEHAGCQQHNNIERGLIMHKGKRLT